MPRTMTVRLGAMALLGTIALAACGGAASPATAPAATAPAADSMAPGSMAPESMGPSQGAAAPATSATPGATDAPPASDEPAVNPAVAALAATTWANVTLTDVATGEEFIIAELAGKPLFIETMAIWCSNCRAQQGRFTEALGRLPAGTAEYVVLTVDPSETAEDLARYKADRGFTGRYAVAGRKLAKALEAEFGPNALNPPSVPVVHVSPSGEVSFSTGSESVEKIVEKAGF